MVETLLELTLFQEEYMLHIVARSSHVLLECVFPGRFHLRYQTHNICICAWTDLVEQQPDAVALMKSCSNFRTEHLSRNSNRILPYHHLLALDLCENNQNGYKIQLSSKRSRNHNFCICRDDHCCTSCTFHCLPDLQLPLHPLYWLDPQLPPDCWQTDTNKNYWMTHR